MTQLEEEEISGPDIAKFDMELQVVVIHVSDVNHSKRSMRGWAGGLTPTFVPIAASGSWLPVTSSSILLRSRPGRTDCFSFGILLKPQRVSKAIRRVFNKLQRA